MRSLSFIIFFLIASVSYAQSPHDKSLKLDCSSCHQATDWRVIPSQIDFSHDKTDFPLIGQHNSVDCRSCHTDLKFKGTPQNCEDCHKDIHVNTVGFDCARCHSPQNWIVKDIDQLHRTSRFPLVGVHLRTDCQDCHAGFTNLTFEVEGVECFDCHRNDYFNTTQPNHAAAGFSTNCQECHSINGKEWASENFAHDFFPLIGGHSIGCFSCHTQGTFSGLSRECVQCHQTHFNSSSNPSHTALAIPVTCQDCHSLSPDWQPAQFPIHNNYYVIQGAHLAVGSCNTCHNGDYNNTPNTCVGCHQDDYNAATNPPHASAGFSTECTTCHSQNAWVPSTFDHDARFFPIYSGKHQGEWDNCSDCHTTPSNFALFSCIDCHEHNKQDMDDEHQGVQGYVYASPQCYACHPTGEKTGSFNHSLSRFPLTGAHITVNCSECHQTGFSGTTMVCFDCHQTHYAAASNPNHQSLGISAECSSCHTTNPGWEPAIFPQHNSFFELTGAHLSVGSCNSCHSGNYTNTPNTCTGCHTDDFNSTTNPSHASAGISGECSTCHTTNPGWEPALFPQHNDVYVIAGAHTSIGTCVTCHNGDYNNTPNTCYGCHSDDFNSTTNPPHSSSGFSTECTSCHSQNAWLPSTFDHDLRFFPIYSGKHQGEWDNCSDCHTSPTNFSVFSCIDCHEHNKTDMDDEHEGVQGYVYASPQCYACHPTGEESGSFNHSLSQFPLTGAHINVNCTQCHQTGYSGTTMVCFGCHQTHFAAASNPNHQSLGISTECSSCHTTNPGWEPALFPQHNQYYELTGRHLQISQECSSCHNGSYVNTPNQCAGCHQDDYNTAQNPNHTAAGISNTCTSCHTTTAWIPSSFNHNATGFALTGQHLTLQCSSCHVGTTTGLNNACVSCHQSDYNNSSNPSHTALQLSSQCSNCHSTNPDWQPALFPDHNSYYPLQGAHSALLNDCGGCHNGNYNTTPNTCFGCHQSDYNATTNPPHQSAGFPTECQSCHTQNAWTPSTFNHDALYFPIYSGKHQGEWNSCSDCHTNPNNYSVFSCIDCHEHNQADMDDEHEDVPGYVYLSSACYSCHPDGEDKFQMKRMNRIE